MVAHVLQQQEVTAQQMCNHKRDKLRNWFKTNKGCMNVAEQLSHLFFGYRVA